MNTVFNSFGRAGPSSALRALRHGLRRVTVRVRSRIQNRYYPEKHYMRGPGPACARRASTSPG